MMGSRGSDEAEEEVVVVSVATCKIVSLHRVSDCWDVGVLKSTDSTWSQRRKRSTRTLSTKSTRTRRTSKWTRMSVDSRSEYVDSQERKGAGGIQCLGFNSRTSDI